MYNIYLYLIVIVLCDLTLWIMAGTNVFEPLTGKPQVYLTLSFMFK